MLKDIHALEILPTIPIPNGSPEPFALITRIPIRDNGAEPLVDLAYGLGPLRAVCPGLSCPTCAKDVARKCCLQARRELPWNVGLIIGNGAADPQNAGGHVLAQLSCAQGSSPDLA